MYKEDLRTLVQIYEGRDFVSDESLLALMKQLQNPKISARMLEKISGVGVHKILKVTGKKNRNGGNLNPLNLLELLELTVAGFDAKLVLKVLENGTSQEVLASLTGFSQSRISRTYRKQKETEHVQSNDF